MSLLYNGLAGMMHVHTHATYRTRHMCSCKRGVVIITSRRIFALLRWSPQKSAPDQKMAASRVVSSSRRFCLRYQLFFYIVGFILCLQLYMGYSFYKYKTSEMDQLEEWKNRVVNLEKVHEVSTVSLHVCHLP